MNIFPDLHEPRAVKLTVDDFELLHRAGALDDHPQAELIDGTIYEMSPQQRPHSFTKNELTYRLRRALDRLGIGLLPQCEVTMTIAPHSAPEPDIAVTAAPMGQGYVPVASVTLVIEVADTTLRRDLGQKRDLYARAGIPEYWVVDIAGREVHQFWAPVDGGYTGTRVVPLAGPLASATIADLVIEGTGIL